MAKNIPDFKSRRAVRFSTLKEVLAYAAKNGFTQHEVWQLRKTIQNNRLKNPKRSSEWRAVNFHHTRKDWFENNANPDMVKKGHKKGRNTKVLTIQIKRDHGTWLTRLIDTDELNFVWSRDFNIPSWDNPQIILHKQKPKVIHEPRPEQDPDYLEID
jgi:hypothetical protein